MNFLRKAALIWMIAWLPLSGIMAATMPFCAQGIMGLAAMQHAVAFDGGETLDEAQTPCHEQASTDDGAPMCQHCDLCHIAGALVPPSLPSTYASIPPDSPSDLSRADFTSFFPEPLPRPPVVSGD